MPALTITHLSDLHEGQTMCDGQSDSLFFNSCLEVANRNSKHGGPLLNTWACLGVAVGHKGHSGMALSCKTPPKGKMPCHTNMLHTGCKAQPRQDCWLHRGLTTYSRRTLDCSRVRME